MSSGQRKRSGGALDSGRPRKQMRLTANTSARATGAEPIELAESEVTSLSSESLEPDTIDLTQDGSDESDAEEVTSLSSESSEPDAIDLTQDGSDESDAEEVTSLSSESSEPDAIDLTQDGSDEADEDDESSDAEVFLLIYDDVSVVMPAEGNQQERGNSRPRGQQQSDIARPSRDDPDEPRSNDVPPGTIRCPICMDFYSEIMQSGRQIVSTTCGHVFCNWCLRYSLMNARLCPTCRADTGGQYHPLYI